MMSGIYGPPSFISSESADLTNFLESRLQARTASTGSTLYRLTWKRRRTPSGRLIPALRATVRRTSGKDFDSTPTIRDVLPTYGGGVSGNIRVGHPANGDRDQSWQRRDTGTEIREGLRPESCGRGEFNRLDNNNNKGLEGLGGGPSTEAGQREGALRSVAEAGEFGGLEHSSSSRRERRQEAASRYYDDRSSSERQQDQHGPAVPIPSSIPQDRAGPTNGFWRNSDWLFCRDERWRPVEPGTFPLVDGSAFRMDSGSPYAGKSRQGILKGYGNAVDAQATIDFIKVCREYRAADRMASGGVDGLLV